MAEREQSSRSTGDVGSWWLQASRVEDVLWVIVAVASLASIFLVAYSPDLAPYPTAVGALALVVELMISIKKIDRRLNLLSGYLRSLETQLKLKNVQVDRKRPVYARTATRTLAEHFNRINDMADDVLAGATGSGTFKVENSGPAYQLMRFLLEDLPSGSVYVATSKLTDYKEPRDLDFREFRNILDSRIDGRHRKPLFGVRLYYVTMDESPTRSYEGPNGMTQKRKTLDDRSFGSAADLAFILIPRRGARRRAPDLRNGSVFDVLAPDYEEQFAIRYTLADGRFDVVSMEFFPASSPDYLRHRADFIDDWNSADNLPGSRAASS